MDIRMMSDKSVQKSASTTDVLFNKCIVVVEVVVVVYE